MTKHVFIYRIPDHDPEKIYIEPKVVSFEGRDDKPSVFFHAFQVKAEVDLSDLRPESRNTHFRVRDHESVEVTLTPNLDVGLYFYRVLVGGRAVEAHSDGPGVIIHPPMT